MRREKIRIIISHALLLALIVIVTAVPKAKVNLHGPYGVFSS